MVFYFIREIGLVSRVFANGPGDLGSIPGHIIPKTLKMVLDTYLLNTQQYKGCPRGVMVKVMDCGILGSEFILQSRYHVRFRGNTFGKGMNPLSSQLWVK